MASKCRQLTRAAISKALLLVLVVTSTRRKHPRRAVRVKLVWAFDRDRRCDQVDFEARLLEMLANPYSLR